MGYIYKITNLLNQHSYIGQTSRNPYDRWREHQEEAKGLRCRSRPLYSALYKYGITNFSFEIIEETENIIEREIYWIDFYNTYKNGYNATLGGEGTVRINVQEVLDLYNKGYNCRQIARLIKHKEDSIARILHQNNIIVKPNSYYRNKAVSQYSKAGEFIQDFLSLNAAANWCKEEGLLKGDGNVVSICNACRNKRKTAYGFIWKYKDNEFNLNKL